MRRSSRRLLLLVAALPVTLVVLALLYMLGMAHLEHDPRGFWRSLEWADETITTTGYGADEGAANETIEADVALVAIGVAPVLPGVIELKLSDRGWLDTNDRYETSVKGVYGAGDIIGPPWLAHVASYEAVQAVEGMFTKHKPKKVGGFPGCTYCHPQVASIGLTERAAKEKGLKYKIGKFPYQASGKALAAGVPEGFVKIIYGEPHGEIIGAHMIGAESTEMIAEIGLAMNLEATWDEIEATIHARLEEDRLLVRNAAANWDVTNLGAILFAKDLHRFRGLARKAVRVVVYEGKGRIRTLREQEGRKGYASGFAGLMDYINALLPRNEVIGKALRREVPMYPDLAVRELVANALIHQDFSVTGAGPMVEVFADRMEITNPGLPLVKTERFLDSPPRSRNEQLASFMRRMGICEERGSGVDKVVFETEFYQLPAPSFETPEGSTRAVLFAHTAYKIYISV